jgi:hypothetical protein
VIMIRIQCIRVGPGRNRDDSSIMIWGKESQTRVPQILTAVFKITSLGLSWHYFVTHYTMCSRVYKFTIFIRSWYIITVPRYLSGVKNDVTISPYYLRRSLKVPCMWTWRSGDRGSSEAVSLNLVGDWLEMPTVSKL